MLLIYSSLKRKESTLKYQYPSRIFAHRGGGILAPENTLAGMELAHAMGFKAVEFDVMLSRDEVPVLMHDPVFGRTVAGNGQVAQTDAAQLVQMNAGRWMGKPEFKNITVPLFSEVVEYCRQHNIFMNIEIKPSCAKLAARTGEKIAQATSDLFAGETDTRKIPLFSSFSAEALQAAQNVAPQIDRAILYTIIPNDWRSQLQQLGCKALHTHYKTLTPHLASLIKTAGYGLFVYTVNDRMLAEKMFSIGVDALCTDRLDLWAEQAGPHGVR